MGSHTQTALTNEPFVHRWTVGGGSLVGIQIHSTAFLHFQSMPMVDGPFFNKWTIPWVIFWSLLGNFVPRDGLSSRDPRQLQMGLYPYIKPLKIVFQVLRTPHTNFKQNKHIKLTQTHQDTQALSKAHFTNVLDVLKHLTTKLHILPMETNITQETITKIQLTQFILGCYILRHLEKHSLSNDIKTLIL